MCVDIVSCMRQKGIPARVEKSVISALLRIFLSLDAFLVLSFFCARGDFFCSVLLFSFFSFFFLVAYSFPSHVVECETPGLSVGTMVIAERAACFARRD